MATITVANLVAHYQHTGVSDETSNNAGIKSVAFETDDTVDGSDVIIVTPVDFGITYLEDIMLFEHTTKDDVIITSATEFTSTASGTSIQITMPANATDKKRVIVLWGR